MTLKVFDLPDETIEMIERFEDYAGINVPSGGILDDDRGYIVNGANTVALVYDEDAAYDDGAGLPIPELTEPASDVTEVKPDDGYTLDVFSFPAGNETHINADYTGIVREVYGVDLRHFPQRVKSHPEKDTWPIRVDDSESETSILIAPHIPPEQ